MPPSKKSKIPPPQIIGEGEEEDKEEEEEVVAVAVEGKKKQTKGGAAAAVKKQPQPVPESSSSEEEEESGSDDEDDDDASDESGETEQLELALDEDGRVVYSGAMSFNIRSFPLAIPSEHLPTLAALCDKAFTARQKKGGGGYSAGETFWIGATEEPKNVFERMAKQIFEFHTQRASFDPERSGAEWWTLAMEGEDEVGFHFDMDYAVEEEGVNLTPHLGTVTYLSNIGAATLVTDHPRPVMSGEPIPQPKAKTMWLSCPRAGKHICFDGRFLHGAPEVMKAVTAAFRNSKKDSPSAAAATAGGAASKNGPPPKKKARDANGAPAAAATTPAANPSPAVVPENQAMQKRLTFLVNIWMNHRPVTAVRYPFDEPAKAAAPQESEGKKSNNGPAGKNAAQPKKKGGAGGAAVVTDGFIPDIDLRLRLSAKDEATPFELAIKKGEDDVKDFSWRVALAAKRMNLRAFLPMNRLIAAAAEGNDAFKATFQRGAEPVLS